MVSVYVARPEAAPPRRRSVYAASAHLAYHTGQTAAAFADREASPAVNTIVGGVAVRAVAGAKVALGASVVVRPDAVLEIAVATRALVGEVAAAGSA